MKGGGGDGNGHAPEGVLMPADRGELLDGRGRGIIGLPGKQDGVALLRSGGKIEAGRTNELVVPLRLGEVGDEGDGHGTVGHIRDAPASHGAEGLITLLGGHLEITRVSPDKLVEGCPLLAPELEGLDLPGGKFTQIHDAATEASRALGKGLSSWFLTVTAHSEPSGTTENVMGSGADSHQSLT